MCFISACLTQIKVDFSLFRSDFFSFGRTFSRLVGFSLYISFYRFFFSWTFTQNSMELAVGRCMFKWNTELHEMHFWYRLSVSQLLSNLKALSHVEKVKTWKIQEEKSFFSLAHSKNDTQRPNITMNWVYQTNSTVNVGVPMEMATTMSIDMKTISLCFPYFREDISIFRYFYFYKTKNLKEKRYKSK